MQLSQMSQQAPKMNMSLSNGMPQQMNTGQPGFPMPGGPQHTPNPSQLSDAERQRVQLEAMRLMKEGGPQAQKAMAEQLVRQVGIAQFQRMQAEGKNPVNMAFYQKALMTLFPHMQRQQQPGMSSNPGMQMQPGQQRPMNPNMMNNVGQPGGQMPYGSNLEKIINEQKQGMLAERQGQMVVPASSGPGHTATSQPPLSGPQNMFPQTPNQTPRPPGMPNGYDLQQQQQQALLKQHLAHQQAAQMQARQQQANLQGQPGGLGGPMPTSQTPAMNNLNAPVGQPPIAMGQMGGAPGAPGNPPIGPGMDARFNQMGQQGPMAGGINNQDPMLKAMLTSLSGDLRARLQIMPKQQVEEFFMKWKQGQGLAPGRPGHPQPGMSMNPADQNNPQGMQMQAANGGLPANVQAMLRQRQAQGMNGQMQAGRMPGPPMAVMDVMDVPPQVFNAIPGIPPNIKKWGQLKPWIAQTNTISEDMKTKLRGAQVQQYMQASRAGMMGPSRGPTADPQQRARPNYNPAALQIPVSAEEIEKARQQNPKIREFPDEQAKIVVQHMKWSAMQKNGNPAAGPQQPQPFRPTASPSTQPGGPSMPIGVPQGPPQGQPQPPVSAPGFGQNMAVAPGKKVNQPQQHSKPAPPNPSPATATKNLKRPSADDQEAPQPNVGIQRPPSQTGPQPPMGSGPPNPLPQPTEAQLASLTPEQRQIWERKRQAHQRTQEFALLYKNLAQEELRAFDPAALSEVAVPEHMKERYKAEVLSTAQNFVRFSNPRFLMPWYFTTREESRLRTFMKMVCMPWLQSLTGDSLLT